MKQFEQKEIENTLVTVYRNTLNDYTSELNSIHLNLNKEFYDKWMLFVETDEGCHFLYDPLIHDKSKSEDFGYGELAESLISGEKIDQVFSIVY